MWNGVVITSGLFAALLTLVLLPVAIPPGHFDPRDGTYAYDPRLDFVSPLLVVGRPEEHVARCLSWRAETGQALPIDRPDGVVAWEPIQVVLSLYTDWHADALVTVDFRYADGSTSQERYRMHAFESGGLLLPTGQEISVSNDFSHPQPCYAASRRGRSPV